MDIEGLEDDGLGAIELFTVKANHGPDWAMDLSTLELEGDDLCDEEGNPAHGKTHYIKHRSVINAADPIWVQYETQSHELFHQVLEDHGIDWLTPEREEALVTYLSPRIYGAFYSLGFRWPKRPKGCAELCRQAILDAS